MNDDMMQTKEEYLWLFLNSDYLDDLLFDNFSKSIEVYNILYSNNKIPENNIQNIRREEVIDSIKDYPNPNKLYSVLCDVFGFNNNVIEEIEKVNNSVNAI